jgi:hypothetical protein
MILFSEVALGGVRGGTSMLFAALGELFSGPQAWCTSACLASVSESR